MRSIHGFIKDSRGNVLMLTGLAILILFATAGAGVDFGRQQLVRMKLQNASDAAAIAAASMPDSTSSDQRRAVALRYYNLNFPTSYLGVDRPTPNIQIGNQITVDASANLRANFVSNVGVEQLSAKGRTVVDRTQTQNTIYDVILAVDNSGSMANPTTAPTFTASRDPNNSRNLGILRCQAEIEPYMRNSWCAYYVPRGGVPMGDGTTRPYPSIGNCQQNATRHYCDAVGLGANGPNGYSGYGVTGQTRLNALRTVALNFTTRIIDEGAPGSRMGMVTWAGNVIAPQPLITNAETIRNRLHDMNAWAGTNPYLAMNQVNSMSSTYNPAHVRAVVLLSDGMPTQIGTINPITGRDGSNCDGASYCAASANAALTICTQMKNAGVQVYTVGFLSATDTDMTATQRQQAQTFLRSCASVDGSGNPRFYSAQNGSELDQAFNQILVSLGRIRISQ